MNMAKWPAALVAAVLTMTVSCFAQEVIEGAGEADATAWNQGQMIFVARLDRADAGPVGQSFPPMYTYRLHMTVEEVLRGGLKPRQQIVCSHVSRQQDPPVFEAGKQYIVSASTSRQDMRVDIIRPADAKLLADVRAACSVPLGWMREGGRLISPWAALGGAAWPADQKAPAGAAACDKTGRPALRAGPDVTFDAAPVPPKVDIKWTNPDGDGEYRITVTNTTDKPLAVPALLSSGGHVLWTESLLIICQGKTYLCPGSRGVSGKVTPTTLQAHQSLSTAVNVLALQGPQWPQGGYRIEFRFCLGEQSRSVSLYYMSRHHDALRQKALKALQAVPPTSQPAATQAADPTAAALREADRKLSADYAALKAKLAAGAIEPVHYLVVLKNLRQRELDLFQQARAHTFTDITEHNYWHRGRLKFPSPIEQELQQRQRS